MKYWKEISRTSMLFNSYTFVLVYLPIVLLGFFLTGRHSHILAAGWLTLCSLFFYGYWNPAYVGLLAGSIICNYAFGLRLAQHPLPERARTKKWLLISAIAFNLVALGYFKYANFFLGTLRAAGLTQLSQHRIILPLGISFFTFTQIAYLVDTYQGKVKEYNLAHFALFVTYFPHLIAGPILHHKEMMPQFANRSIYRFSYENAAVGLTMFAIGLFKKVVLADSISEYANHVFDAVPLGNQMSFIEAWGAALAYALQLYFDFSGYSDMAVGLSRMFGVVLPVNFYSPYKSTSIIEFWQRWHMTLSRFLRDYLYIPLGGSRRGEARHYANLMITMLLGGLWHGAGWTFVLWGGCHGVYLLVNHGWLAAKKRFAGTVGIPGYLKSLSIAAAWLATFLSVVVAWVIFRASDIRSAASILASMGGMNGLVLPEMRADLFGGALPGWLADHGVIFAHLPYFGGGREVALILGLLCIALYLPNTYEVMGNYRPALSLPDASVQPCRVQWRPSWAWVAFTVCLSATGLLIMRPGSDFLYFQF